MTELTLCALTERDTMRSWRMSSASLALLTVRSALYHTHSPTPTHTFIQTTLSSASLILYIRHTMQTQKLLR